MTNKKTYLVEYCTKGSRFVRITNVRAASKTEAILKVKKRATKKAFRFYAERLFDCGAL